MLANLSNVLVVFVLARSLSSSDYGSYTQLMAIFLFVSITGTALSVNIVRSVRFGSVGDIGEWRQAFLESLRKSLLPTLGLSVGLVYLLHYELPGLAVLPTTLILLGGLVWMYLCAVRGFLQAERDYQILANSFLLESCLRVILVLGGARFGLVIVAAGYFTMALILSFHSSRKRWGAVVKVTSQSPIGILRRSIPTIVSYFALISLMYLDIVIIGHRLPSQRGSYGAISQMSKFVVYGAFALASLVVAEVERPGAKKTRWRYMSVAIAGLYVAMLGVVLIGVKNFGGQLISWSFGASYMSCIGALVPLTVGMGALGVTILVANSSLGLGNSWSVGVVAVGAVSTGIYVWGNSKSVEMLARADMWAQLTLMCILCVVSFTISYRGAREGR